MKKLSALLVPAVMIMSMAAAVAAEKRGHISAIDSAAGTMTVGNNWHFTIPDTIGVDSLAVGDNVKVYFKTKKKSGRGGDQHIVRRVHVID